MEIEAAAGVVEAKGIRVRGRRGESVVSEALTAPVFRLSAHKKDQESERQAALAKLG